MSATRQPTITPQVAGDNRFPLRAPTRAECAKLRSTVVKAGAWNKADLYLVDLGEGPLVVKDFRAKNFWIRQIGRVQVSREFRAYRWLGPLHGLPRLAGRVDAYAVAMEHVGGVQLGYDPIRLSRGPEFFPRICRIVEALHQRGLVHWDLRTRDNVLAREDGEVFILDLASAFWLRPGGLAHRWFFRRMCLIDRSALLKWKGTLGAGEYTAEEQAFLERFRFWRSLWFLNRKKQRKRTSDAD